MCWFLPEQAPSGSVVRLNLPGIRGLEVPGPGAAAHMSLHLNITMSKSRPTKERTVLVPRAYGPGDSLSVYVGDRSGGGLR